MSDEGHRGRGQEWDSRLRELEPRLMALEIRVAIMWRVVTGGIGFVLLAVMSALVALVVRSGSGG